MEVGCNALGAAFTMTDSLSYLALEKDAKPEYRYTFGPLYAPDRIDAHGEFTTADALQTAVWDFVRMSAKKGRAIHLQHHDFGEHVVGEWVDVVAWPWPHTVTLTKANEQPRTLSFPAGTVWLGVIWSEDCWPLVKSGAIGGMSMGGRAVRVAAPGVQLKNMGDHVQKSGRVLSKENIALIRELAQLCEELLSKEPRTPAEKSKRASVAELAALSPDGNGVLMVCDELDGVVHAHRHGTLELLYEATA